MIERRTGDTPREFFKRTIAAQIHFITALVATGGLFFLLDLSRPAGSSHMFATLIFSVTAILVFGTSATYHFLLDGYRITPALTERMEKLDQWAIYLFIAGTYSPFLLNAVHAPWRLVLMVAVWSMAILGILYTAYRHRLPGWARSRVVYTSVFLVMGWTLFVRIGEIVNTVEPRASRLLLAGALFYSVGAVVYITKRPRLFRGVFGFHELWHTFVTAGFACHFAMIASFYR